MGLAIAFNMDDKGRGLKLISVFPMVIRPVQSTAF